MQTFLPTADFRASLESLDKRRLWKQAIEASTLILVVEQASGPWWRHPAARMWRRHVEALRMYYNVALDVAVIKHRVNTLMKFVNVSTGEAQLSVDSFTHPEGRDVPMPPWLGDVDFHRSHRSNLLRKDAGFYGRYGWDAPNGLPYLWPRLCLKYHEGAGCGRCGGAGYTLVIRSRRAIEPFLPNAVR